MYNIAMSEREIKVSFGTLFTVPGEKDRVDVVINTGEEGWFFSAQLVETDERGKSFFLAGTASRENIKDIVGKMTTEEVFIAAELGASRMVLKNFPIT